MFSEGFQFNSGSRSIGIPLSNMESVSLSPEGITGRAEPRKRRRKKKQLDVDPAEQQQEEDLPSCADSPLEPVDPAVIPQPIHFHGCNGKMAF